MGKINYYKYNLTEMSIVNSGMFANFIAGKILYIFPTSMHLKHKYCGQIKSLKKHAYKHGWVKRNSSTLQGL